MKQAIGIVVLVVLSVLLVLTGGLLTAVGRVTEDSWRWLWMFRVLLQTGGLLVLCVPLAWILCVLVDRRGIAWRAVGITTLACLGIGAAINVPVLGDLWSGPEIRTVETIEFENRRHRGAPRGGTHPTWTTWATLAGDGFRVELPMDPLYESGRTVEATLKTLKATGQTGRVRLLPGLGKILSVESAP